MRIQTDASAITPGLPIEINYFTKGYQKFGILLGYHGNKCWYQVQGTVVSVKKTGVKRMQLVIREYPTGELRTIRVDSDDAVRVFLRPLAASQGVQATREWVGGIRDGLDAQRRAFREAPKGYAMAGELA
jgi:hypothetical protein